MTTNAMYWGWYPDRGRRPSAYKQTGLLTCLGAVHKDTGVGAHSPTTVFQGPLAPQSLPALAAAALLAACWDLLKGSLLHHHPYFLTVAQLSWLIPVF